MTDLEFWPDYGPGPLWAQDGKPVDVASLGLSDELAGELAEWNAAYAEDKVRLKALATSPGLPKGGGFSVRSVQPSVVGIASSSPNHGGASSRPDGRPLLGISVHSSVRSRMPIDW